MADGKGITTYTTALPHGENAMTLFETAHQGAFADLMFAEHPGLPVKWWNWYMTTPSWAQFFRVGATSEGVESSVKHVLAGSESVFLVTEDRRPESVPDMPGTLDNAAETFLSRIATELSNRRVPRLRGQQMRLPEEAGVLD